MDIFRLCTPFLSSAIFIIVSETTIEIMEKTYIFRKIFRFCTPSRP